jgi:hypothetical protein
VSRDSGHTTTANLAGLGWSGREEMAHREFRDENGGIWQVWDVFPSTLEGLTAERQGLAADAPEPPPRRVAKFTLPVQLRGGWLAFQSQVESRRLAPIPSDWVSLPDSELAALVRSAPPTRRHGRSGEDEHPHTEHARAERVHDEQQQMET